MMYCDVTVLIGRQVINASALVVYTAVTASGNSTPECSAITAEVGLRLIAAIVALCLSFPDHIHIAAVCKGGFTVARDSGVIGMPGR